MENRLATLFQAGDEIIDVEELLAQHDDLKTETRRVGRGASGGAGQPIRGARQDPRSQHLQ